MSKSESTSQLAAPQQPVEKHSPLSLQYSHPREYQLLAQSSSVHATPKRKTERVLSAPSAGAVQTRVNSGVSSSVSSAQIPPQSHHVQPGSGALAPRRQAPHQPATASAAAPTNRIMKPSCVRPGSSVGSASPAPGASTAHGNEGTVQWPRRGSEMSTISEKIELNLLNVAAPSMNSPVATWDVSSVEKRSSPRNKDDVGDFSADNSAFQHDGKPKVGENPYGVEAHEASVGTTSSSSITSLSTERYAVAVPTSNTSFSFVGKNPISGRKVSPSSVAGFQASSGTRINSPAVAETLLSSPAKTPKMNVEYFSKLGEGFPSKASKQSSSPCKENLTSSHGAPLMQEVDFKSGSTASSLLSPISEQSALINSSTRKGEEKVVNVVLRNDTKEHRIKLVSQRSVSRTSVSTTEGASSPGKKSITSETSLSPYEETFVEPVANPIRPLSLQSNITLHIKPEAIYSGVPRPAHTALQMEFDSLGTPRKSLTSIRKSSQGILSPESENKGDVCIDMLKNSPLKKSDPKTPGKKATSFLTELLSQSSNRRSSKASTGLLKFWGGNKLKNKKQEFGSTVAMAGSNSSNSDSTASELSENSSLKIGLLEYSMLKSELKPLPRSGLCNEYYDASAAKNGQFPSTRHDSNSSSLGYGESSSLLANTEPGTSSSLWLSSKLPWRNTSTNAKQSQTNSGTLGQSSQARESDFVVPDAEQDDDEAWFDSVTKLNEQWFKPGAVTALPASDGLLLKDGMVMASTDTPVGKTDVANLRGVALFDGLGLGDGQGIHNSAHDSVASGLLNIKSKQLGSNNSYGSLNTPISKNATTYKSFGTTIGQNSSSTELSNHLGCGPQKAFGGKYRTPLASSLATKYEFAGSNSGSTPALNKQTNLRKQLHTRAGLLRPQLQRKSHSNLMKINIDDAGAVKEIEAGLLRLMEEFQAGNLTAFGHDSRLRQMEAIREQQESLAKLHQEVGGSQDLYQPLSTEALRINDENMSTLMGKLACLSVAIEKLECSTAPDRKSSHPGQHDCVKSPSDLTAPKNGSSEGIFESSVPAQVEKEALDEIDGVVLRRKGATALLQKSMSLGKSTCASAGDIEMSKIKKGSSVARSSSQKHSDRKSGFDTVAADEGGERSSGKEAEIAVRPASALAFESQEIAPENIPHGQRHRQHHHRHRHSQEDQKHTRKKSNKESVAKTDNAVLVDQQSGRKTDCGLDATEMQHFGSHDSHDRSSKRKSHDGTSHSAVTIPQVSCTDADVIPTQKQPPTLPARPNRPLPSPVPPSKQFSSLPSNPEPSSLPYISAPGPPSFSDSKRRPPSLSDFKQGSHSPFLSKHENSSPVSKPGSSPLSGPKVFLPASKQNPSSQPLLTNAKDPSAISYRSTAPVVPTTTLRSQTSVPSQSKGIVHQTSTYPHSRTVHASPIFSGDAPNPTSYTRHQTTPILPGYGSTTRTSTSTPPVALVSTTPSLYTQTPSSFNSTDFGAHAQEPLISSSVSSSRSQTPMSSAASSSRTTTVSGLSSRIQTHPPVSIHASLSHPSSRVVTVDSTGSPAVPCALDRPSKKASTEKTSLIFGSHER
ncbi:protein of unknown function DUF4061 [Trinorchestia longiramus]|nr:protein of unknown function DUF4061 [Trinorchestia longiramus]